MGVVVLGVALVLGSLGAYGLTGWSAPLVLAPVGALLVALHAGRMTVRAWLQLAAGLALCVVFLFGLRDSSAAYAPGGFDPRDQELHELGWLTLGVAALLAGAAVLVRRSALGLALTLAVAVLSSATAARLSEDIRRSYDPCACDMSYAPPSDQVLTSEAT